jgi:hypothetical protein
VIGDATLGNRAAPCLYYLSRLHRSTHEALDAARGAPGHWQPIEWAQLPERHRIPFAHYDNRSLVNLIVKPSMAQALWPNQSERFCAVEARKWQLPLSAVSGHFPRSRKDTDIEFTGSTGHLRACPCEAA